MPRRSRRNSGFSLVEVLCAVAVAASAIAVLTSGVGGSIKGANKLDQHLGARLILQSILDDELAAGQTAPAQRAGESGPYRWRLDISPVAAPESFPRFTGCIASPRPLAGARAAKSPARR